MYEGFRNIKIFFSFFYIKQKLALENLDWSHICQFLSCISCHLLFIILIIKSDDNFIILK